MKLVCLGSKDGQEYPGVFSVLRITASSQREGIIPLYTIFIRPHPEYNSFGQPNTGRQRQTGASSVEATKIVGAGALVL